MTFNKIRESSPHVILSAAKDLRPGRATLLGDADPSLHSG